MSSSSIALKGCHNGHHDGLDVGIEDDDEDQEHDPSDSVSGPGVSCGGVDCFSCFDILGCVSLVFAELDNPVASSTSEEHDTDEQPNTVACEADEGKGHRDDEAIDYREDHFEYE